MPSVPASVDIDFQTTAKAINLPLPTATGDAATKAYVDSAIEGLGWKDEARVATQGNTNLAAPGAAIDGITMLVNDRVLVRAQTVGTENGIYIWNGAAVAMTRSLDANTFAELVQAVVSVSEGTSTNATFRQTVTSGTLGSTTVTFASFGTSAPAATESTAGIAQIATQVITDAGADDLRFVTALKLKTSPFARKAFAATFGDGAATSFAITHGLGTIDVDVTIWETGGSQREVICEKRRVSTTQVTVLFNVAPALNSLRAVVTA